MEPIFGELTVVANYLDNEVLESFEDRTQPLPVVRDTGDQLGELIDNLVFWPEAVEEIFEFIEQQDKVHFFDNLEQGIHWMTEEEHGT